MEAPPLPVGVLCLLRRAPGRFLPSQRKFAILKPLQQFRAINIYRNGKQQGKNHAIYQMFIFSFDYVHIFAKC